MNDRTLTSNERPVIQGIPATIVITAEESDRWNADPDLRHEVEQQARSLGCSVQVCTLGGYMPAAFVSGSWM